MGEFVRAALIGKILLLTLVLVTMGAIALLPFDPPPQHFVVGLVLGSLYGSCLLASAWTVLEPGGWMRWPLSLALCFSVPIAWYIRTAVYSFHERMGELWLSACLIVLLIQGIAWPCRIWLGLRICKSNNQDERVPQLTSQFGIQHLMLVTTVVAVIVGGGRMLFPYLQSYLTTTRELGIFVFLIVAACVLCIPLAFSILALRKALLPTLGVIVFAALATFVEIPLFLKITRAGGGPDWLHLTLINLFTLVPVFAASFALRLLGYRLARVARDPAVLDPRFKLDQDFQ